MKGNKLFLVIAVALLLVGFAAGAYYYNNQQQVAAESAPRVEAPELIEEHNPILGAADAKVTIVEFMDPECESCREMHKVVKQLMKEYEGKIRVVIRYMPFHGDSLFAASALEEAREQGKYEQALDLVFEKQPEWGSHEQPKAYLIPTYLVELGIDKKTLDPDELMRKHGWRAQKDFAAGQKLGVEKTPTYFVNGRMLNGIGYDLLKTAIESELAQQ